MFLMHSLAGQTGFSENGVKQEALLSETKEIRALMSGNHLLLLVLSTIDYMLIFCLEAFTLSQLGSNIFISYSRYDLYLSFEESIFGGQREIQVPCFESCEKCNGTGARSSSSFKSCKSCGGRGAETKTQRTPFGMISEVQF